jgi:hypothetical protein
VTYTWWDALKDFIGALGPVMIAIPWLRDFYLRYKKQRVEGVAAVGALERVKNSIQASLREKINAPKIADFVWTTGGLLCIFGSFVIAIIRGMTELL